MLGVQFLRRAGGLVPVSENNPLPVSAGLTASGGAGSLGVNARAYRYSGLITRPANTTPYSINDAIGTTDTAIITMPNMGPPGGWIQIQSVTLLNHVSAIPTGMTAGFRLVLFSAAPTAIADNAGWTFPAGDRAAYLNEIELPLMQDLGDTLRTFNDWSGKAMKLADGSTTLYALLLTLSAFTPSANSTVFDLRVNAMEFGR
jgi:hypothetical protein